ncbi:hypothetical protein EJV44_11360 [Ancylobacter aquaticus]|nr:hypothetical protein EJV44_11360 [Ancylobacter aquaticus]
MKLGDVVRFTSDQAIGHDLREKMHVFICRTEHHRAPEEYAFLFISKANHSFCYPIAQVDYPEFLQYDSFISCGNLVFYSRQYLLDAKMKREGALTREHLVALRNHLADHDVMVIWQASLACGALAVAL